MISWQNGLFHLEHSNHLAERVLHRDVAEHWGIGEVVFAGSKDSHLEAELAVVGIDRPRVEGIQRRGREADSLRGIRGRHIEDVTGDSCRSGDRMVDRGCTFWRAETRL